MQSKPNVDKKKYTVYVVSHTHWDREWYRPFQVFRKRLVQLVDTLLDLLEAEPQFRSFILDGQAIVLEDYLEIRPEARERIKKMMRDGRLLAGPWYVLPDEFLISGEAMVRNLLIGSQVVSEFGDPMRIGYVPDSFGHVSQLPLILRGFGIDNFIFTRGMGPELEETGSEFIWEGPEGSRVFAVFQVDGYGNYAGAGLGNLDRNWRGEEEQVDFDRARERAEELISKMASRARTGNLLFNNGSDHLMPQPRINEIIGFLNREIESAHFRHATFDDFVSALKSDAKNLAVYRGELRCGAYQNLLGNVLSSRMEIKQANEKTQVALEKYAEPWASLAWFIADCEYPASFLRHAWKLLISNHPHDSICGCSIDQVHREMMPRFSQVQQIAALLTDESLEELTRLVDTSLPPELVGSGISLPVVPNLRAEEGKPSLYRDDEALVVFNSHSWPVSDYVEHRFTVLRRTSDEHVIPFSVFDDQGRLVPSQSFVKRRRHAEEPSTYWMDEITLRFWAEDIPPLGYGTYFVLARQSEGDKMSCIAEDAVTAGENWIENSLVRVQAEADGSLSITHKPTGTEYAGLLVFEDVGDAGDEYDFSPLEDDNPITTRFSKADISTTEAGPLQAFLMIRHTLRLPAGLTEDRRQRKQECVDCPIQVKVSLCGGSPRIDVEIEVSNKAKDHRLRVLFPTGIATDKVAAETVFDVIERPVAVPEGTGWYQPPNGSQPQQAFVAVDDGCRGLCVINRGIPEYEAMTAEPVTDLSAPSNVPVALAITLLRCVGWLSRNDLVTRTGHAGPGMETPEAQCLGSHSFELSLLPFEGSWKQAEVWRQAHQRRAPLMAKAALRRQGGLPKKASLLDIRVPKAILSGVKRAEDGSGLILRLWNPTDEQLEGCIVPRRLPVGASEVNLAEREVRKLAVQDGRVKVKIGPHGVLTVALNYGTNHRRE